MEKGHGISEKAQNSRRLYDFNATLLQTSPCGAGQLDFRNQYTVAAH